MKFDYKLIAMVDDSSDEILHVARHLRLSGVDMKLLPFKSGLDFMTHLEKAKERGTMIPQVLLLDIAMPEMNGFEVLKKLRADKFFDFLHIIMFSSSSNQSDREKALDLGADEYQIKQFGESSYVKFFQSLSSISKVKKTISASPDMMRI